MRKKLTITLEESLWRKLQSIAGKRGTSRLIESVLRPYLLANHLDIGYAEMARDQVYEAAAMEWVEGTQPVFDEP